MLIFKLSHYKELGFFYADVLTISFYILQDQFITELITLQTLYHKVPLNIM